MQHSTRSMLPRPVVHACFVVASDIGRYALLTALILLALPVAILLLCCVATVATTALLTYAAARAIVPPGREQYTLAALTELYNWLCPAIDTDRGDKTLERLEASGIDLGNPAAVVNAVFPIEDTAVVAGPLPEPVLTPELPSAPAEEQAWEGMSGTLALSTYPTDHYTRQQLPIISALPSLPPVETTPTAPPAPRKVSKPAPRKATAKPLPMPTAARATPADTYVRRSGGRYSKVGGRVKPRQGEQLYRHDDKANGGRGGYVEI